MSGKEKGRLSRTLFKDKTSKKVEMIIFKWYIFFKIKIKSFVKIF